MTVRFTPRATGHIADILEYVSSADPRAARRVIRRIRASIQRLDPFPRSGRSGDLEGTFELIVPGLPYIVVYRINAENIDVLGIFHAARAKRDN